MSSKEDKKARYHRDPEYRAKKIADVQQRRARRRQEWKRRHDLLRDTYDCEGERKAVREAARLVIECGLGLLSATVRAGAPSSSAVLAEIKKKDPQRHAEIMAARAEGGQSDD